VDILSDIRSLRGVGEKRASLLKREAGIETIEDLLYYAPRRYIDRSSFKPISECFVNETVTVSGTIVSIKISGFKKKRLELTIDDGSDSLVGVFFAGIDYFSRLFAVDDQIVVSGKINFYSGKQMVHPEFDLIDSPGDPAALNTGRIVPLYPSTDKLKRAGFDSRGFRRAIKTAIDMGLALVSDMLDPSILHRLALPGLQEALIALHFPDSFTQAEKARRRLAFNELFFLQYYLMLCRYDLRNQKGEARIDPAPLRAFVAKLPFTLTPDQEKALEEIMADLGRPYPMNRLIQGDVGSGKTVVALGAALTVAAAGRQVAIMAPTEVLARQHYATFRSLMPDPARVDIITGTTPAAEKKRIYQLLQSGELPSSSAPTPSYRMQWPSGTLPSS
jgi:ATP-dependent DNA helicase RecG